MLVVRLVAAFGAARRASELCEERSGGLRKTTAIVVCPGEVDHIWTVPVDVS